MSAYDGAAALIADHLADAAIAPNRRPDRNRQLRPCARG
jgi:hypothetical protein